MNRKEYLSILRDSLSSFSYEEMESALAYYNEFFDDAGPENEQAVIASLGDPKKLAETIIKESGINVEEAETNQNEKTSFNPPPTNKYPETNTNNTRIALIIILILTFPFWIGFVGAAFGIIVAIVATTFAISVAVSAVAITCLAVGIAQMFIYPPLGLLLTGVGLIALGIAILAVFPLCKLVVKVLSSVFKGIATGVKNLFNRQGAIA